MQTKTTITIDDGLLDRIREYCQEHDIKISAFLRSGARKLLEGDSDE